MPDEHIRVVAGEVVGLVYDNFVVVFGLENLPTAIMDQVIAGNLEMRDIDGITYIGTKED